MIYVIAGNHNEAYEWINRKLEERISNGESAISISEYKYVHDASVLKGIQNPSGIFIGSWINRKDLEPIFLQLLTSIDISSNKHRIVNNLWGKWKEANVKEA